jgi:N-acetylglutamate synthase-like GNAT family acetyltransferase
VIIRRATQDDAARVAELNGTLGYPTTKQVMLERLSRILELKTHAVFVAETPGEVVGWIHGAVQDVLAAGKVAGIWGLVVREGSRGDGVGRRLVEAVEEWARGSGFDEVSVRSNVVRPESHAFYERLGYIRVKTQHAYRKPVA